MEAPPNVEYKHATELYGTDSRPAVIVGAGESLDKFDFKELDDERFCTIAINDQAFMHEEAYKPDYWIFSDRHFFKTYANHPLRPDIKVLTYERSLWNAHAKGKLPSWTDRVYVWRAWREFKGHGLFATATTATVAVDFARRAGAPSIALLGIDCSRRYHKPHHRHGGHQPRQGFKPFSDSWQRLKVYFDGIPDAPSVYNCSFLTYDLTNERISWEGWKQKCLTSTSS